MARMIPSCFQDFTISTAEKTLFYALQKGLVLGIPELSHCWTLLMI
jgi:hypothetical protein